MKSFTRIGVGAALAVGALIAWPVAADAAPKVPVVHSVFEGRDAKGAPVVVLMGFKMNTLKSLSVQADDAVRVPYDKPGTLVVKSSKLAVWKLPADIETWGPDLFDLVFTYGRKATEFTVNLRLNFGEAAPASVNETSIENNTIDTQHISAGLQQDLEDADTVDGFHAAYFAPVGRLTADDGVLNDPTNLVDWSQLKNVPASIADGVDTDTTYSPGVGLVLSAGAFSVDFGGDGSASRVARSDHSHQGVYQPAFTSGTGLLFSSGTLSVLFGGPGGSGTVSRSDHDHSSVYATPADLADLADPTGSVNTATNPVDWTQLKSVPAGLADGTDDSTTYLAGTNVQIQSDTISVGSFPWASLTGVPAGFADGTDDGSAAWTVSSGNVYRSAGKVAIGTTVGTPTLEVSGNDGVLFGGTLNSGAIPATGAGVRMMWYPNKAAFRAGYLFTGASETDWDAANVGQYSWAGGNGTKASGQASLAFGVGCEASGVYSTALGDTNTASGRESFAIGDATTASGESSASFGDATEASGRSSAAFGDATLASGNNAVAMGESTTAQARSSLVLGRYNTLTGTNGTWSSSEPLFVCGNGSGTSNRNDGFVVFKNGTAQVNGSNVTSDERLKRDIRDLPGVLAALQSIRPVQYEFNDQERYPAGLQLGLIAQEVQAQFPELVREGTNGYLGINYAQFSAVLLRAVQEQQQQTESAGDRIAVLEQQLATQALDIAAIRRQLAAIGAAAHAPSGEAESPK